MKLTDAKETVITSYTYGIYGELLSGDKGRTSFLYNGRMGVTTDDNGLYYMRQRYYNPEIKRFVNQDILTGNMGNSQSLNRYSYVQGNPVSYTDPFGLSPLGGLFTGTGLAHGILGVLGCLPGIPGAIFNGIDAWVYAAIDKDYFMATMAGLSAVSLGVGSIAKWAGKAAKAGIKGAKVFGYMSTIGTCMSNGIEFAQNGVQTAVAAYDAWSGYTQTGSFDAGAVASVGLSALSTIWSGVNLSKSSKEFGKMLNEDGVAGKIKQAYKQFANDNRGCVDLDALGGVFGIKSKGGSKGGGSTSGKLNMSLQFFGGSSNGGPNAMLLYRGDSLKASPDIIFNQGFIPKGTHSDALLHNRFNAQAGNFVSTTEKLAVAKQFATAEGIHARYIYEIYTSNYIDMNVTYGKAVYHPHDYEFLIPDGIKPSEIVGAYEINSDLTVGKYIPNPNFGGG